MTHLRSSCAGVIVSGIALVLSCCLREGMQLTDSLKQPAKASLAEEEQPLLEVCRTRPVCTDSKMPHNKLTCLAEGHGCCMESKEAIMLPEAWHPASTIARTSDVKCAACQQDGAGTEASDMVNKTSLRQQDSLPGSGDPQQASKVTWRSFARDAQVGHMHACQKL